MKKIINAFVLGSSLLLSGACKDGKEDVVPPCLITKITTVYTPNSGSPETTIASLEYDANKMLVKVTDEIDQSYATYTYSNGLVANRVDTNPDYPNTQTWTYQNKLISRISVNVTGGGSSIVDFIYSGSKITSFTTTTSNSSVYQEAFEYNGDNVISNTSTSGTNSEKTLYSGFDSKNNPYLLLAKAIGNQVFFIDEGTYPEFISKNNPGLVKSEDGSSSTTYTYEYNAKGYPTKIIGTSSTSTNVTTFEYMNCD